MVGGRWSSIQTRRSVSAYDYELKRGDEIIATGRLVQERPLVPGETITINGETGIIDSTVPGYGQSPQRLIIKLANA